MPPLLQMKKRVKLTLALALTVATLTGCGAQSSVPANNQAGDSDEANIQMGLETTPILDYEIPSIAPGILVNRSGYESYAQKIALVKGIGSPVQFHVVDANTKEIVYSGSMKINEYNTTTKEFSGYGDFSEFNTEGTFYLECDHLGRSYNFVIKADMYDELMTKCLNSLNELSNSITIDNFVTVCDSISTLLLSYELYAPVYEKRNEQGLEPNMINEVKLYIDNLLGFIDRTTGTVCVDNEIKPEETAWLAAVLAKFSYSYQKTDSVYANACLQAADKAWKYMNRKEIEVNPALMFYGASELYRATGKYNYHQVVKELGEDLLSSKQKEVVVYGTLTYSLTKRKVDVDICEKLLGDMLTHAETIAEKATSDEFGIGFSLKEENLNDIMWEAVIMSSIDFVITNNEYATIIQNFQNYIAGQNEEAVNYLAFSDDTDNNESDYEKQTESMIGYDFENTARYIMVLSEMMSHEEE